MDPYILMEAGTGHGRTVGSVVLYRQFQNSLSGQTSLEHWSEREALTFSLRLQAPPSDGMLACSDGREMSRKQRGEERERIIGAYKTHNKKMIMENYLIH